MLLLERVVEKLAHRVSVAGHDSPACENYATCGNCSIDFTSAVANTSQQAGNVVLGFIGLVAGKTLLDSTVSFAGRKPFGFTDRFAGGLLTG